MHLYIKDSTAFLMIFWQNSRTFGVIGIFVFKNTVDCCYLEYSISRTLLYLEQFIRSLGHLVLDQSKKLSVSRISIFRTLAFIEQILWSLEQFFLSYLKLFSKFPKLFAILLLKLAFFRHPAAQLCRQEWV